MGVGLFLCGWIAQFLFTYAPSFPYADSILAPSQLPQWIYSWANFDGVHYLTIAEKGYLGTGLIQAFFPLLPAIFMRGISLLFGGQIHLLAFGLFLTNAFALLSVIVWFAFLKQQFSLRSAWFGTVLLLVFPTSFFFGALYTESLFFLCVIGAFLSAERHNWLLAGVFTACATATRIVGIFLVPALLIDLWLQWREFHKPQLREFLSSQWRSVCWIAFGSIGLIGYMVYLWHTFGDPIYFLHVQSEFGAGRSEGLVIYPQVVWRSLKMLFTVVPDSWRYYTLVLEFLAGCLGLVGLLFAAVKSRISYSIFALGAFALPTLTGTFSSMPRYILICFPLYLLIIRLTERRPRLQWCILVISAVSMVLNCMLFIQGYWVS